MKYTILYYGPQVGEKLIASLKSLKKDGTPYAAVPPAERFQARSIDQNEVYFADFKMKQADIRWYRSAAPYINDQKAIVDLYNSYFGVGMGAIVFQTIREAKALAYSTQAVYAQPARPDRSYDMHAYVGTQVDKFDDATTAMNEILNTLPQSPQGLENAKVGLIKSTASERINGRAILNAYVEAKKFGHEQIDIRKSVYDNLAHLTLADITAFHKREISNKPYSYCVVAEENSLNAEDLNKIGQVKKLTLKEIFGY